MDTWDFPGLGSPVDQFLHGVSDAETNSSGNDMLREGGGARRAKVMVEEVSREMVKHRQRKEGEYEEKGNIRCDDGMV